MTIKKLINGYMVDIQPGGREGRRIRQTFLTKEAAQKFERKAFEEQESRTVGIGSSMPVCTLIEEFKEQYARIRMRGFEDEQYRLKVIREFFERTGNKALNHIRLSDGASFIAQRLKEGKKPGTINRDINSLKRIFTWAVENDYIPYSPFDKKLKHLKGANSRVRWLADSEANLLLVAASSENSNLEEFIFMGLETGLRLSNLKRLEASHIGQDFITAVRTKSDKPYDVPISSPLKKRLGILQGRVGYVLNTTNIERQFRNLVKKAGLWTNEDDPLKVTIHTLRHTFAARWLQKGVPIYTVSKWMGHSSIKMTESVYGHLSQSHHIEQMREAERRQNVDAGIIPFPQSDSESNGVDGIRTRGLCLDREEL